MTRGGTSVEDVTPDNHNLKEHWWQTEKGFTPDRELSTMPNPEKEERWWGTTQTAN